MASALISGYMDYSNNLHSDLWNSSISCNTLDYSAPNSMDKSDVYNVRPTPLARRHSSSVFGQSSNLPPMSTFNENVLFGPSPTLDTVCEEKFRSRAFSEGSSVMSHDSVQDHSATSRYKTELCRPFEENGKCKYGDKCQFAHGKHELRRMARHPKYKTELCRTYHTSGFCPYGPRCHFIHNQDDLNAIKEQDEAKRLGMQLTRHAAVQPRQTTYSRPRDLQLMAQNAGRSHVSTYSPTNGSPTLTSPSLFSLGEVISPISPLPSKPANIYTYNNSPTEGLRRSSFSENRQSTPPLTTFDVYAIQPEINADVSDDLVFDGQLTPPDSDRESITGSPKNGDAAIAQRLPIFRCLSQSD
uniref:C3H1-type domain-containing protein n=1 Tax=Ciona savignyi TaxID=51511 RepID=H2YHV9_CIOSA